MITGDLLIKDNTKISGKLTVNESLQLGDFIIESKGKGLSIRYIN